MAEKRTTRRTKGAATDSGALVPAETGASGHGLLIETETNDGAAKRSRMDGMERRALEEAPSTSSTSRYTESTTSGSIMLPLEAVGKLLSQLRKGDRSLPKFSGEVLEWPGFISKYRADEHDNSDGENLERLERALTGAARRHVQDKLGDACFLEEIINELETEYGGIDSLIKSAIEHAQRVKRLDSRLKRIGEFVNETIRIQKIIRQCGSATLELPLLLIMKDNLPTMANMRWGDYQRELGKPDKGNFNDFVQCMKRLKRECGHDQSSQADRPDNERERETRTDRRIREYEPPRRPASGRRPRERTPPRLLFTKTEMEHSRAPHNTRRGQPTHGPTQTCLLGCKSAHDIKDCPQFQKAEAPEKFAITLKYNRCHFCYGNHRHNECEKMKRM